LLVQLFSPCLSGYDCLGHLSSFEALWRFCYNRRRILAQASTSHKRSAKHLPTPLEQRKSGTERSMDTVRLEIAVDNPQAVLAAARGGAERLELCSSLADGGLTPSLGFVEWTMRAVTIPVHCIVRPRAGNFVYSPQEIDVILADIAAMARAGVHGVVVGALTAEHALDRDAMQRIADTARPMRLCFHRAFDLAADREQALEDVIACGAQVLLTSGGAVSLTAGAPEVRRIVRQARGRIEIMGGAGVRLRNAAELWRTVPVDTLHASLRSPWREASHGGPHAANMGSRDEEDLYTVREEDVRAVLSQLEPRAVTAS
jgi:copper homeostasis protein